MVRNKHSAFAQNNSSDFNFWTCWQTWQCLQPLVSSRTSYFLVLSDTWNRLLFCCTHKLDKFLRPLPKICFLILIQQLRLCVQLLWWRLKKLIESFVWLKWISRNMIVGKVGCRQARCLLPLQFFFSTDKKEKSYYLEENKPLSL